MEEARDGRVPVAGMSPPDEDRRQTGRNGRVSVNTVNGFSLEQEDFNLTSEELLRLRALLKLQFLAPTFWSRAFTVLGYLMATQFIVLGVILFLAFVGGLVQGLGGR
jgi:hypothetical protein